MKYLVNGQRKVIRKGEYVEADTASGECILNSDTVHGQPEFTVAVLKSICENNSCPSNKSSTRGDLIQSITANLPNNEIAEQKTMTQSAIIKEIVTTAGAARTEGLDPDVFEVDVFTQCIERLNSEGITFKIKQLGKFVQAEIAEQGFIMSNVQRKKAVYALCDAAKFEPKTWAELEEMMASVQKEVVDTDEKKALSLVRRYLKDNEMEIPKKEKEAKLSYRQRAINFMIENSPVSDAALTEFVTVKCKKDEAAVERLQSLRDTVNSAFDAGVKSTVVEPEADAAE